MDFVKSNMPSKRNTRKKKKQEKKKRPLATEKGKMEITNNQERMNRIPQL